MKKLFNYFKKNGRYIYLEYGVFTLLIIWPLLAKGYVFAMDMTWPTHFQFPNSFSNFNPIQILLWLINFVLPSWLIQKIVIFSAIFLSGIFAHKLIRTEYQWPKYFAGLLYVLTPFFYSRFLYGQIWHLVAYALMPLLVKYLFDFFETPNWKKSIKCAIIFCLITFISIHFAFIAGLVITVLAIIFAINSLWQKNYTKLKQIAISIILLLGIFLLANSFWLIPLTQGNNAKIEEIQFFDANQLEIFKTDAGQTNIFFNVLSMYGFWGDRHQQYSLPKEFNPLWWLISIIFICIVSWGIVSSFIRKKRLSETISMMVLLILGTILSIGIAFEPFKPIIIWLNDHVPFYKGFREPQKFSALIVLSYCYLAGTGLIDISERLKNKKREWFVAIGLILIILYNPLIFNGFRNQMFVTNYPKSWREINQILTEDNSDYQILFLPWHLYMSYSFAKDKVTGPLGCVYFNKPVICGDNMELDNTFSISARPFSQFFTNEVLNDSTNIQNLGERLRGWNIKYIILAKEVDWQSYNWLNNQSDLIILKDSPELILYENKNF